MNLQSNTAQLMVSLDETKKGAFIGIKGYTTKEGEVQDLVINGKVDFSKVRARDLKKLKSTPVYAIPKGMFTTEVISEARKALIDSLSKPSETHSQAQKDAYVMLGNGLKLHKESQELSISGMLVHKTVHEGTEAERKSVQSRVLTLAKKHICYQLGLTSQYKWRMYKLGNLESIQIKGISIKGL